jgi:hypothetical protein
MTPEPESDNVTRSLLVDVVARRLADAVATYATKSHDPDPPPAWDELDRRGRNRYRAAVIAAVTDPDTHPALVDLVRLVMPV